MQPFIITFNTWSEGSSADTKLQCFFDIKQEGLFFNAGGTLSIKTYLQSENREENILKKKTLMIALQRIREELNKGIPSQEVIDKWPNNEFFIIISPEEINSISLDKSCAFQKQEEDGLYCGASDKGETKLSVASEGGGTVNQVFKGDITSSIICNQCLLPEDRIRCMLLDHPQTKLTSKNSKDLYREFNFALCNEKGLLHNCSGCVPGNKECWKQFHEISQQPIHIPDGLPDRVVDEIDYLNLYIKDVFKTAIKLFDLRFYRPISELHGKCQTAKDFTTTVQALGTVIEQIKAIELLPEDKRTKQEGSQTRPLKSIEALEQFIQTNYSSADDTILKTLRHIVKIRNSYPAHPKEAITSFEALNIEHPIRDYQKAWLKILNAFYDSLKALRTLVQTGQSNS